MSVNAIIEFDDLLQHSFDASKIEITGGQAKLKSQALASEVFFYDFGIDAELTSRRGGKELVFGGAENTGKVLGGVLNFPNQDLSNAAIKNITNIVDDFSFKVKVNMSIVTIVADRDIINMISNIDNSKIRFYLMNDGGGKTRIKREIIDSAGAVTDDVVLIIKDFSIDPDFEISFLNDDNGNTLTYVNGVLFSTVASPTFDFTDFDFIFNDGTNAVADFDDAQLWNAIVDLAIGSISPEDTTYPLTAQEIITAVPFIMDTWTAFSDNKTVLNGSLVKHQPLRDSARYFFDTVGAIWKIVDVALDKFLQSNLDTIINTNLPTFPLTIGIGTTIQIASLLKASDDGYTTPILDTITLKYGRQHKAGAIGICTVIGVVKDKSGLPVVGAEVQFSSKIKKSFLLNNVLIGPTVIAITDSEGKWSISLVETASTQNTVNAKIDFKDGSNEIREFKNLTIPDLPSKDFEDIVLGI